MTAPFVVAGGIVRNRAWVLPRHLHAVAMNRPEQMFYVTGDNTDETIGALRDFQYDEWTDSPDGTTQEAAGILNYTIHNTGEPSWTRDGVEGPRYKSSHMAAERNLWASEALKRWPQASHLWVVDSDVLPEPDVLERLLALEAPVAAAYVPVGDGFPIAMIGKEKGNGWPRRTGEERLLTKPHAATLVGGCYLMEHSFVVDRDEGCECENEAMDEVLMQAGLPAMFGPARERNEVEPWGSGRSPLGEDGDFAERAEFLGHTMIHDPGARCRHLMQRDS